MIGAMSYIIILAYDPTVMLFCVQGIKRLRKNQVPDLSKFKDVSEFMERYVPIQYNAIQYNTMQCRGDGYESDGDDLTGEMQVQVEKGRIKKHTEQSQVVLYGLYAMLYFSIRCSHLIHTMQKLVPAWSCSCLRLRKACSLATCSITALVR